MHDYCLNGYLVVPCVALLCCSWRVVVAFRKVVVSDLTYTTVGLLLIVILTRLFVFV